MYELARTVLKRVNPSRLPTYIGLGDSKYLIYFSYKSTMTYEYQSMYLIIYLLKSKSPIKRILNLLFNTILSTNVNYFYLLSLFIYQQNQLLKL